MKWHEDTIATPEQALEIWRHADKYQGHSPLCDGCGTCNSEPTVDLRKEETPE